MKQFFLLGAYRLSSSKLEAGLNSKGFVEKNFIKYIVALVLILVCFNNQLILCQNKPNQQKETKATTPSRTPTKVEKNTPSSPAAQKSGSTGVVESKISEPQQTTTKTISQVYDTIIRLGGRKIACNVIKINPQSVTYINPFTGVQYDILRKDIEKIKYRNGKVEVFNKPVFSVIDKLSWQSVMITENESDVQGLYKRGVIKANASSGSRSPKAAKQSAMIRLQKKAANIGALIVLLVRSEMKGGYGEIPGWELEGIAFSDTPPADTAAVNKEIRELLERTRTQNALKK